MAASLQWLVTEEEAAELLSVSRQFLRKSRIEGNRSGHADGPPYVRVGRCIRYDVNDLKTWIERNKHQPGGQPQN